MIKLPIAETFHSIQGEGYWVGTPMHFVRLAGCPVGFKASKERGERALPLLSNNLVGSLCRTWDGRYFDCDTDFSCHTYSSVYDIIATTYEKHICLTGGEPLMHFRQLVEGGLFAEAHKRGIQVHVETSGSVDLPEPFLSDNRLWVTVAPKWGYTQTMLARANEVKFLVDDRFSLDEADKLVAWARHAQHIFLSPVNGEKKTDDNNLIRTLEALRERPGWRLSVQLHKYLGVR